MAKGISIKNRVVITRDIRARTSSHTGLSPSPGVQVGDKNVKPISVRTQTASIVIYQANLTRCTTR
jgi:hypothetical protein